MIYESEIKLVLNKPSSQVKDIVPSLISMDSIKGFE